MFREVLESLEELHLELQVSQEVLVPQERLESLEVLHLEQPVILVWQERLEVERKLQRQ